MKKQFLIVCCAALISLIFMGCQNKDNDLTPTDNNTNNETLINDDINNLKYETDIPMEDPVPIQYFEIDKQLQAEVDSGNYSINDPLVIIDPYHNSPLTAVAIFSTDEKLGVRVTVKGKLAKNNVSGEVEAKNNHRVPIIGLYAGTTNNVILELIDDKGNVVQKKKLQVETDPLPSSMIDIIDIYKSGKNTAYNLIMVSGQNTPHPFAFDHAGDIRWYLTIPAGDYGIFPLTDGNLMLQSSEAYVPTEEKPHTTDLYEIDYLGRIHQVYYIKNGYHHEVIEKTPGGNLIVLSSSIDGHVEDTVEEIDRNTGEIIKTLDMRELFGDTYRDMIDWAHLNTASYVEDDNSVVLSPRNIHSGIKVDWKTNELKWILADPRFWEGTDFEDKVLKPIGDIVWHYQQHTVYQLPYDLDNDPETIHVMLYDNHWQNTRKISYFDKLPYSYVTLYTINEKKMTVKQDRLYEGIKSNITSNFQFDYEAKRVFSMGGHVLEKQAIDENYGMIYEYDYDSTKIINQYGLKYRFYRAYEMVINLNVIAAPMDSNADYVKGVLKAPAKTKKIALPKEILDKGVDFKITGNVLYMKAGDHTITTLSFIGKKNYYTLDFTNAYPGEKKYAKLTYNIAIPLAALNSDTYTIAVNYKEKDYNTNQTITIK